jgi:hypothetical protein
MELATILINLIFGQFTSRVYQRIFQFNSCEPPANGAECNVAEIFRGMSEQEIERDIVQATRLIHTVFFTGVTR